MRLRKLFVALLFLVLFAVLLLTGTRWGLGLIVKGVNSFSGGAITVGSVEGRLATAYTLGNIHLETASADIDIETFQWAWHPLSLFRGELDIVFCKLSQLTVTLKVAGAAAEKETGAPALVALLPPLDLVLKELLLSDLQVRDMEGDLLFHLLSLSTKFEIKDGLVRVTRFNAESPDIGLEFHGNVARQKDWVADIMGNWRLAGYGFHPSRGAFSLKGAVDSLGVQVSLTDPGEIRVVGVVKDLFGKTTWSAGVDAQNINLEKWIYHCPEIILAKVHGDLTGDFGHYRGHVEADGFWGVADQLHLSSDLDGDGLGIVFATLGLGRKESYVVATGGSISWEKLFSWVADLEVTDFDLDMFFPGFDSVISSQLHSVGDVTEEGLDATFDLRSMQGRFADYVWSATGSIGLTEESVFSHDLRIESDSVGGVALVRGTEFSWENKLSWMADVDLTHFDPAFLHPMAAGDIKGNISSTFEWHNNIPIGEIRISRLAGTLGAKKLSGGGNIAVTGTALSTSGLLLSLGDSQLLVSGELEDSLALQFSFESPDLSDMGDQLRGELTVQGQLFGTRDAPEIGLTVVGENLQAGKEKIKTVQGHLKARLGSAASIDAALLLEDSLIHDFELEKVDVVVSGTALDHSATARLSRPDGELSFLVAGRYTDGWQATISQLALRTTRYGEWAQQDVVNLELSAERAGLQGLCLAAVTQGETGSVCLSGSLDRNEVHKWSVDAELIRLELQQFAEMNSGLPGITGRVDATLTAGGDSQGVIFANGNINIPEVDILFSVADADDVAIQVRESVLRANLQDQRLALDLSLTANKGGALNLNAQVQGIGKFASPLGGCPVEGTLILDKYYLSSLAVFSGYAVESTGWVSSTFVIGGTLGQPEINGEIAVQEGGIDLPYQGITLDNVVIAIDSKALGANIQAEASSGGGHLGIVGSIAHGKDGIEATLQLSGDDFLLVNLPEYSFRVTPDATLKVNKNRGGMKGRVYVSSGLIAPEELSGAVKVSEDVIFLGEEKVHVKKGYPFFLDLDVELGDDVKVDGYGLKGRLGGKLNVKITPADFITGKGELDLLDSTFTFYGRSLDIARGRILFTGGPIDNPGVDIRAQKVITAETARDDEYTVGVDINGLVQDLQSHLFSDPFMEDTDILSQMVVGHSFATSSEEEGNVLQAAATALGLAGSSRLMKGIGDLLLIDDLHLEGSTKDEDVSLVVGKRITKDLYIGYDMNMFSQLGQFRVRYELSRGFYVETRSSSESTGADLIYTFEK
ncbi:MAG: hypothetical protein COA36_01805 [Desulfotalea sp.]|nr:MAG: hypothetical protein COA36_01805 [Desulfotalea sp.]